MTWQVRFSSSRQRDYYYNTDTGQSQWDPPAGFSGRSSSSGEEKAHCLHVLFKHVESRRPSSHRTPVITLSKAAARQEAQDALARLCANGSGAEVEEEFRRLARERSDCSSAPRDGDLGEFTRGKMQPSFEQAAFAAQPQSLYPKVVESDSGFHLIYRV